MPPLKTKAGKLTSYAFACGYVERKGGVAIEMQHGVYFVKGFDAKGRLIYDAFRTLALARKRLSAITA